MKDADKIKMVDSIITLVRESQTSNDMPIMIGTLNIKTGVNGFEPAEPGHPVFEYKDKYIIYLKNAIETVIIPYNKPTLSPHINFTIV